MSKLKFKYIIVFFLLISFHFNTNITAQKIKTIGDRFTISDTLEYENTITSGKISVLYFDESLVDTFDNYFGLHILSDKELIYQKFITFHDDLSKHYLEEGRIYGWADECILFQNGLKTDLKTILPYYNDDHSHLEIVSFKLHYWGLKKLERNGEYAGYNIYAIRYDLNKSQVDSLFLFNDYLGTDDRGYFLNPFFKDGKLHYYSNHSMWVVDESFKIKSITK